VESVERDVDYFEVNVVFSGESVEPFKNILSFLSFNRFRCHAVYCLTLILCNCTVQRCCK